MKVLDFKVDGFVDFLNKTFEGHLSSDKKILIIGIAEGGLPVAEIVLRFFEKRTNNTVGLEFIKIQRPSTLQKKENFKIKKTLKLAFSILPKFVLNYLRIVEHKKLSKRRLSDLVREIKYTSTVDFSLYNLILIVDDAVDSGITMKTAVNFVSEKINENISLQTLSVVVTQSEPVYMPDHFWFRDVLIRFPWSLDGK